MGSGGAPGGDRSPARSQLCPLQQAELLCPHLENGRVPGSVSVGCHDAPAWLNGRNVITSQLWRLEAQGRGLGRLVSSKGPEGEGFPALSQRLAASGIPWLWTGIFNLCLHAVFPPCVSVSRCPLFVRTPVMLD